MDVVDVPAVVGGLGYAIPVGTSCVVAACFAIYARWQMGKQDKDRAEHVAKWDSMIKAQRDAMQDLINSYESKMSLIMDTHQRETDRLLKLYERSTSSIEVIAHKLTILVKDKE